MSERFILSIASWNLEEKVLPVLEGLGLWGYFLFPKELPSIGHEIEGVICIDDRTLYADKILLKVHNVDFIHMWVDVEGFDELKKLLEGS
ncbi:hypothetical protein [Thermococcus sp. CX2]|uniref:hypothetical protein n=1 Tax=Thermococcus sp. CX2 TaxID=163006 RepID=UPI001F0E9678|nr:hypothetical protein [Thermococcus sp. CX2]